MDEFRTRTNTNNKASSHIRPDEVKDGTLEDIIMGLKSKPYRAAENGGVANGGGGGGGSGGGAGDMRRSFRQRRHNNNADASRELHNFLTSESEAL